MSKRAKRLLLWTIGGTAGDLRPAAALAVALQKRGRETLLVTADTDRPFLERAGVDVERNWRGVELPYERLHVWATSPQPVLAEEEVRRIDESFRQCTKNAQDAAVDILRCGEDFCGMAGPVASVPLFVMPAMARKLPFFLAGATPGAPSSDYLMSAKSPRRRFGGWENRLKWAVMMRVASRWILKSDHLAPIREVLDPVRFRTPALVRFYKKEVYHLAGVSPVLFPRPRDWTSRMHVTGYAYPDLTDDWQPPPDLDAFMKAEPKPIYVGFGSFAIFSGPAGRELLRTILEVIVKLGKRAIVQIDPAEADLADYGERVFAVKEVPYSWLFPQCEAVLHHGGGGTSHWIFRSGRPMICYPYSGSQFFWAHRAAELGVAPPFRNGVFEVEPSRLEQDLRFVEQQDVQAKARSISQRMVGEPNGAEVQADIICRVLDGRENGRRSV